MNLLFNVKSVVVTYWAGGWRLLTTLMCCEAEDARAGEGERTSRLLPETFYFARSSAPVFE